VRAGHRRAGGGPDVEDDATGHSSEHGACQRANSEFEASITAQLRSAEHYSLDDYSFDGPNAEGESHDTTYRHAGERWFADQHCGQGGVTAGEAEQQYGQGEAAAADHEPTHRRAGETWVADQHCGQGGVTASDAERQYGQGQVSTADTERQHRQGGHPSGGDRTLDQCCS
jgi:hypothetical protein